MITVENLSKSFGGQVLFAQAAFQINSGERVGLVGRNGHGKTTLFRILTGEESPDSGNIIFPRNYRIGHVRQSLDFSQPTVLAEGMEGLPAGQQDQHWQVEKILGGLGFTQADMSRAPSEFSGGFQVRLNLAKVLVSEPDLLLLDEPTNYLDITSIRWIQRFLINWPRELMIITHDRGFMDPIVTHTLAIHRGRIKKIAGDTEKLYQQIAQEEEIHEKTRQNEERRKKDIAQFISRFRAKARLANMVQSRIKMLEKMENRQKLSKIKTLDFSFRARPFEGKTALTVEGLRFGYAPDQPLIEDFSINIGPKERIGVIGKNGRGKTTLLKLLAGELSPQAGEIHYHRKVAPGLYEQTNIKTLVDERTVEEEIIYADPDTDRQKARNICGAMMFSGDDALKRIGVLSGGEKSRVMLGKLLVTPLNFLLLDEPTNHLDMESCDALLAAIDDFDGAVMMVTHSETFLRALADRLVVFQSDGVSVFDGGYQAFLEKRGWEEEADISRSRPAAEPTSNGTDKLGKKELRRRRSEIISQRAKAIKPLEKGIAQAEAVIEQNEKSLEGLHAEMQEASENGDGERITEIARAIHDCEAAIEENFEKLERLTAQLEEQSAGFDQQLAEIGG